MSVRLCGVSPRCTYRRRVTESKAKELRKSALSGATVTQVVGVYKDTLNMCARAGASGSGM